MNSQTCFIVKGNIYFYKQNSTQNTFHMSQLLTLKIIAMWKVIAKKSKEMLIQVIIKDLISS